MHESVACSIDSYKELPVWLVCQATGMTAGMLHAVQFTPERCRPLAGLKAVVLEHAFAKRIQELALSP